MLPDSEFGYCLSSTCAQDGPDLLQLVLMGVFHSKCHKQLTFFVDLPP